MHSISVCVGSSCHLKGAYDVIQEFKRLIQEKGLHNRIELKASFCLGRCQAGVSILLDDQLYTAVTRDTAKDFFDCFIQEQKLLD